MPFVGAALQRIDGRWIVLSGLLIGASAMFIMQGFTLEASYWDFVWPRMVLGFGLGMIFVPLTTPPSRSSPSRRWATPPACSTCCATSAAASASPSRPPCWPASTSSTRTSWSAHVNPFNPILQQRLAGAHPGRRRPRLSPGEADQAALALIYGMVQRQAGMLSYNHIFWILGIAFLAVIPFLLLLRRAKPGAGVAVH